MNEERQHAYFQLIEALLACPSGEELEILQVYPDLLDQDLRFHWLSSPPNPPSLGGTEFNSPQIWGVGGASA
jgi:hypothetical protein